jgi:hypothetical protein
MFTIARFEKQCSYRQGYSEILRIACRCAGVSNPDSEALPPGGSFSGRKSSRVTLGLQLMIIPNVLFPLTSRLTYPRYARTPRERKANPVL